MQRHQRSVEIIGSFIIIYCSNIIITFTFFANKTYVKNTSEGVCLELVHSKVGVKVIVGFMTWLLRSITHHENQLKHYWKSIIHIRELYQATMIDINVSEKLKCTTKSKAQSQH